MTLLNRLNEMKDWNDLLDLSEISDYIKSNTGIKDIRLSLKKLNILTKTIEILVFSTLDDDDETWCNVDIMKLNKDIKSIFPILSNYNIYLEKGSLDDLTSELSIRVSDYNVGKDLIIKYNDIELYLIFNVIRNRRVEFELKDTLLSITINNKYSSANRHYIINYEKDIKDINYHIKNMIYTNIHQLIKYIFNDSKLEFREFIKDINRNLTIDIIEWNSEFTFKEIGLVSEYFSTMDKDVLELLNSRYRQLVK